MACLRAGFNFLGEDYVGLEMVADGHFVGHSLYNSLFLETSHLSRFPELTPYIIKGMPHEEKSLVILSHVFPDRLERCTPIRAVVVPRVVDTPQSQIRLASKGQTLLGLGPSSLIEIPSRGIDGFSKLAQLVEEVPTYSLELGHHLESIPGRLEEILTDATR